MTAKNIRLRECMLLFELTVVNESYGLDKKKKKTILIK